MVLNFLFSKAKAPPPFLFYRLLEDCLPAFSFVLLARTVELVASRAKLLPPPRRTTDQADFVPPHQSASMLFPQRFPSFITQRPTVPK